MVPTRSDVSTRLRTERARLVADTALGGPAFGSAYAALLDECLLQLFQAGPERKAALVALGSYARGELCPGSDVDLLLVHDGGRDIKELADALWYPLWDAGLVVGHATRTLKEAAAVADSDMQALTSMLDVRHVAGDPELTAGLTDRMRRLAHRRRPRMLEALAQASEGRRDALIGDLLEPNLKEGGGGLRDVHSLVWMGWALDGPGGIEALVQGGYLQEGDPALVDDARRVLLTARVALHRVTGGKGDDLRLEDQDAVARLVGEGDADALALRLAGVARKVAWVTADVWARLRATQRGPLGRLARRDRSLAEGVVMRDGQAVLSLDAEPGPAVALRLAAAAARAGAGITREALTRLGRAVPEGGWNGEWDDAMRADLFDLLNQGHRAIPVVEALDHAGVWGALLPEWSHVRSLPQRNAYHRFTVDRHLLEAVARTVELATGPDPFDRSLATGLDRPELLGLAALLHDIGKGLPGDHSESGAAHAAGLCRRIGLDLEAVERIERIVRHHLLLADVATRRDLSEEATAARVARLVGDVSTLELLYLVTVGDSLATGPAAWNSVKAALVRELFVKAAHLLERGEAATVAGEERRGALAALVGADAAGRHLDAMDASYQFAFAAEEMREHIPLLDAGEVDVVWSEGPAGSHRCTVVAPDRPGMFSLVAGVLAVHGLNVQEAAVHTRADGMALEVFRVVDDYGRIERHGTEPVSADVAAALDRHAASRDTIAARIRERAAHYEPTRRKKAPPQPPEVVVDEGASDFATVVEVHADDRVGLLYDVTSVFAEHGLDVHLAKVTTIGDRVVDAFYLRDASGGRLSPEALEALRGAVLDRLASGG